MGIDVGVADLRGYRKRPRLGDVKYVAYYSDDHEVFESAVRGTPLPMLSRANPYGSLVLVPDDMDQFISEIRQLAIFPESPSAATIIELAEYCALHPGTELHLVGD